MVKTVYDLIKALTRFDPEMPVVFRKAEEKGAFSDWVLHTPTQFYPNSHVCLSAFEPVKDHAQAVERPAMQYCVCSGTEMPNCDDCTRRPEVTLTEKCIKKADELVGTNFSLVDELYFFARDIRNEALEEAAKEFNGTTRTVIMSKTDIQCRIRALKDNAREKVETK